MCQKDDSRGADPQAVIGGERMTLMIIAVAVSQLIIGVALGYMIWGRK